jgi:preprotein translocase subunit SecE
MRNIFRFLQEVKAELWKVTWPTKDQVVRNTLLILGMTLFMAVFLGSLDYVFSLLVQWFIAR